MLPLKLTQEIAADIRARVKSLDFAAVEKISKAKDQNGTFDVIISTEVTDRAGEVVRQDGWDLTNYKNNPIVLWGHDYYSLPIGICTDTYNTTYRGVPALGARGVFLSADINPFAQQVRRMYEYGVKSGYGVGCTTSVGFIPKEFDPDDSSIITRSELLEFSFVPVPANQGVGAASGRSYDLLAFGYGMDARPITFAEAKGINLDLDAMRVKGVEFAETLGYVPKNVSEEKASEGTSWSKPTLTDFTDKQWEDLSDTEKRHIAGHYAYSKDNPPESFGDLKLPHHEAKSGAVVWNGVKAAMGALMGARGGVDVDGDKKAVYDHLAAHYRQFEKEPPELNTLKAAEAGDDCTMDDGTLGVLAVDPNDPDGALICQPKETKAADVGHASEKALLKAVKDEHDRHTGEMDKAFDAFNSSGDDKKAALKDLKDAVRDEHTMHRAKSVAAFRSFKPSEDKAFDKNPHLKALREEHDAYQAKNDKVLDDLSERLTKKDAIDGDGDNLTDWITGKIDANQTAHSKSVRKIAKSMCKEAFGEEDEPDEKVLEILHEHLASYVPEPLQRAVFQKVGARISSATREKLGEAHQHMKAATAIVEALHGGLGNDDGEESRSDGDDEKSQPKAPAKQRSRPAESPASENLNDFLLGREIVKEIQTVAQRGLQEFNKRSKQ